MKNVCMYIVDVFRYPIINKWHESGITKMMHIVCSNIMLIITVSAIWYVLYWWCLQYGMYCTDNGVYNMVCIVLIMVFTILYVLYW